jgi:peptide/nickel transport system permease protein
VRKIGKQAFEQQIAGATHLSDFFFDRLSSQLDIDSIDGRARLVNLANPLLAKLPDSMFRQLMVERLAELAGTGAGSLADRLVGVLSVAVIAVPSFVVAIYALLIFAVSLRWLPAIGAGEPGDLGDQIVHLILPSIAVGLGWVGYIARMVRASMLEVLEAQHIRTARAFGLPDNQITYQYALTIAILPTITLLGVGIGQMLSSAVFAEIVFARPGVGKLVYDAILTRNYPLVTGAVLVTTVLFVLINLIADLIVGALDPRVRSSF